MALKEVALGGIYFSPLLVYAILGLLMAATLRWLLHRWLGSSRYWHEAWLDTSLFVICTAAFAWLGALTPGAT
ncbi:MULTISPECIES: DUF1656 domain-containing protein [Halomonas]|uniref:DUF1656 domain-containing protein n=1 Tax=Halomonas TaxID=2745 RepID=UPI001C94BB26|nr:MULTISPECIES: DUF1656 domain-containing protein [Halomonas]MBY5928142.1 DUF1656 domain-containing protein [Halomonas sp. DP8Y7-3]MBY6208582.1 DUF1656 domain-containing protein [Halomonas sp. DP3Y7-2]MBY6227053.1 DUF1656 domain-containing protein [Halomonas sp. DP3Y7-1]MCA0915199.1 DUF1656 domain-containing protein [Halomonas denitrificans]